MSPVYGGSEKRTAELYKEKKQKMEVERLRTLSLLSDIEE